MAEYDKLVRDRIPEIIRDNGEYPVTHTVEGDQYEARLVEKLEEEVEEYIEDRNPEELADVLEVVHALRTLHDVSAEQLHEIREQKADARGRFDDGVVLDDVDD